MPEEVLFTSESVQSRSEIADYLRRVADSLEAGGEIKFQAGEESIGVDPAERSTFEVKVEREGAPENPEQSVEFEIEWAEGETKESGGDLQIE